MSRNHMKNIVEKLVVFQKKPKVIEGRRITEWFSVGEDIFEEFYNLGASIQWNYTDIRSLTTASDIVSHVTKNQEWLQTFINLYPNLRIDLDLVGSATNVCKVRSGIEVLLKGFKAINSSFDKVLKDLEELGELEEFDRCLKVWANTGHRPDFDSVSKQSSIPRSHFWWY